MAGEPTPEQDAAVRLLAGLRATRHFLPEPVPRDATARILEVARWTGSARNRQPWRLAVVEDRERLLRLSRLGPYAQRLAGAPLAVVIGVDHAPAPLGRRAILTGRLPLSRLVVPPPP